jgi:hypothetical protein
MCRGVLGVVQAFGESGPALVRHGGERHEHGEALDVFEPGLPRRVTNVSCRGCIRRPIGDAPGPTVVRGAPPLREEVVRSKRTRKEKESTRSSHSQSIAHRGACGKARVVLQDRGVDARTGAKGSHEMRVALLTYESRGDVELIAGLAVQLRTLGAEVQVWAPPDCAEPLGNVGVSLVPIGGWR